MTSTARCGQPSIFLSYCSRSDACISLLHPTWKEIVSGFDTRERGNGPSGHEDPGDEVLRVPLIEYFVAKTQGTGLGCLKNDRYNGPIPQNSDIVISRWDLSTRNSAFWVMLMAADFKNHPCRQWVVKRF